MREQQQQWEMILQCDCGNRDSIGVSLPECSASCGRKMVPVRVEKLEDVLVAPKFEYITQAPISVVLEDLLAHAEAAKHNSAFCTSDNYEWLAVRVIEVIRHLKTNYIITIADGDV